MAEIAEIEKITDQDIFDSGHFLRLYLRHEGTIQVTECYTTSFMNFQLQAPEGYVAICKREAPQIEEQEGDSDFSGKSIELDSSVKTIELDSSDKNDEVPQI